MMSISSLRLKSFDDLPNEIMDKIFDNFSTEVILSNREVCKKWQEHGALICRRRNLHLKNTFSMEADNFFSEITAKECLPWSSFNLRINSISFLTNDPDRGGTLSKIQIQKFIQYFGNQVKKLWLTADEYTSVTEFLMGTPNIEYLNFSIGKEYNEGISKEILNNLIQNKGQTFQLKNLKIFKTTVKKPNEQKLLKAIISHSPNLKYVKILSTRNQFRHRKIFGSIISSGLKMPAFGIKLTYHQGWIDECKFLNVNKIKIRKLKLNIGLPEEEDEDFFEQLEKLFQINSNILEKLNLSCEGRLPCHSTKLRIPDLQALSYLKLFQADVPMPRELPPFPFFHSFASSQCQNLKRVVIQRNRDKGDISFFKTCQVDSVRSLTLCDNQNGMHPFVKQPKSMLTEDWTRVFPNITELTVTVNAEGIRYIFEKMQKLLKLDLAVNLIYATRNAHGQRITENSNINSLLCGNTINPLHEGELETDVSILSLKELKTLELCVAHCNRQQTLTDAGIDNSLLLMKPLEKLTLEGAYLISEECKVKLSSYHKECNFHTAMIRN